MKKVLADTGKKMTQRGEADSPTMGFYETRLVNSLFWKLCIIQ